MTSLIGLINKIQRACTVLGDHGGEGLSLWEALPSVAVVGGQVPNQHLLHSNYNAFYLLLLLKKKSFCGILELREIVGARKCGRKRFSASWIW